MKVHFTFRFSGQRLPLCNTPSNTVPPLTGAGTKVTCGNCIRSLRNIGRAWAAL